MPRGGGLGRPRSHCLIEDDWPDSPLHLNVEPEVLLVHDIAVRLRELVDAKIAKTRGPISIEDLADEIDGVSHQTIRNIIQGRTWPDLMTIARLERYFDRKLWGNAHKKPR